jgi:hypothetical protein
MRRCKGLCSVTSGCVLHAEHAGKCRVAKMEDVEYEVETILRERKRRGTALALPHSCAR